ncbi:beta-glucanase (GH16 family) [Lewinella aquimaris]|uniref:Beta-glucanase (GH16 family) n=1 Tax=Neolewinella aquimaris TaxID=1835722 RepID=A0A840EAX3_9BACT|nr:family 16 glycosylhydrolase [Neolewinella aquimaris]MBB4080695.1 beta-glucanase (GH16 family) [Neolewinella aquimaris]
MQHIYLAFILTLLSSSALVAQCPELVWSDEFDGDALNTDNWTYEIGDGCDRNLCGWGNNELQSYQRDNAVVSDGTLKITARRETVGGSNYTSSRIISRDKQDFTYGRMEARIKLPSARGSWPAFWMLSTDEVYGTWPKSGEIDIMEYVGNEPNQVLGTIHYGQAWPNNSYRSTAIDFEEPVYDEFHEFAIEWRKDTIDWFMDGVLYATQTRSDVSPQQWPFDQDFFFILNLAVGGNLGGAVTASDFPTTMEVDYVRVYGGNRPHLTGARTVENRATGQTYSVGSVPAGTTINWTVPAEATIVSGQGTSEITVDWGTMGGMVTAEFTLDCGAQALATEVSVGAEYFRESSLENFDDEAAITFNFSTGTLTEADNPAPNEMNASARVGSYVRDGGSQYDVLVYNLTGFTGANGFVTDETRFSMDLYTDAPVGTEILLQLETEVAQGDNYPTGRHSRYKATTTVQNSWERLTFTLLDQPDASAPARSVSKMILLFAPNSYTGSTYVFDNLDIYTSSRIIDGLSPQRPLLQFAALPNPVTDLLTLRLTLDQAEAATLDIFSRDGRLVERRNYGQRTAGEQSFQLPVDRLPSGLYVARLNVGSASGSVRFVKE